MEEKVYKTMTGSGALNITIGVVLLVFVNKKSYLRPYIAVLRTVDHEAESKASEFLKSHTKKCVVKSKTAQKGMIEITFDVRLQDDNTDFINALSDLEGVESAVLVSYNGEYMA